MPSKYVDWRRQILGSTGYGGFRRLAIAPKNLFFGRWLTAQVSSVPGVKNLAALQILSEIGTDMSRFPTDGNLVSWACICPRSDESAGKRRSTRIRKGSPWLKTALVQCAHSAARTKGSYFQALFHRIRSRRGPKKARGQLRVFE
jgi:transposase